MCSLDAQHSCTAIHLCTVACLPQLGSGDDDIEMTNTVVSLKCPLSGVRIVTPARFAEVHGMAAFDLDSFISMAERTRKWQCPHRWGEQWRTVLSSAAVTPGCL
jgi:hypothetical protein